jgi:hypothetical protein
LSGEQDAIHKVVGAYYDAFARDPEAAAAFYGEPTLIVLPNEILTWLLVATLKLFWPSY